jgi:methyltransferase
VVNEQLLLACLIVVIAVQRVTELRLAKRNLDWALAQGGRLIEEPHYWMFFALHGSWLLAWPIEAWLRGLELSPLWPAWLAGFALAEALRYWAISSLGPRWNTKIVVIEGAPLIRRGPYRFIAHPNYLAVALELLCVPMIFGAWITALACTVLNAALLLGLRIPAEIKAVRTAASGSPRG